MVMPGDNGFETFTIKRKIKEIVSPQEILENPLLISGILSFFYLLHMASPRKVF